MIETRAHRILRRLNPVDMSGLIEHDVLMSEARWKATPVYVDKDEDEDADMNDILHSTEVLDTMDEDEPDPGWSSLYLEYLTKEYGRLRIDRSPEPCAYMDIGESN